MFNLQSIFMKFYVVFICFILFFSCFSFISLAEPRLFVGVSPSVIDVGEIERGSTTLVKFYIVTVSEEPLLVYLETENGKIDFFNGHFSDLIFNYSEEDSSKWIKYLVNPVELKPQNETLNTGYETIKGWREVNLLLEIPKNAEPGYHLIIVKPNPRSASGTEGRVGTKLVAISSVSVFFKIPGDAKREGLILDSTSGDYSSNQININTYFQNIGTTTITARAIQKIYDKDNNFITQISSPKEAIKPKEIKILKTPFTLDGVSFGNYEIFTTVSYTTDSEYKNSSLSITPEILAAKPKPEEFPTWIFIVLIIIIAIVIYRRIK